MDKYMKLAKQNAEEGINMVVGVSALGVLMENDITIMLIYEKTILMQKVWKKEIL